MKRFLVYCLILMGGGMAVWPLPAPGLPFLTTRSSTVRLEPIGYDLTFTVAWGWGMEQKFKLDPAGAIFGGSSSGWLEIWDKPYNGVLSVYKSVDGKTYYFSTGWIFAFTFEPQTGELRRHCYLSSKLRLTELGSRLYELEGYDEDEAVDLGAPQLWTYVKAEDRGEVPVAPPKSRYYADLLYLGKFGVIDNVGGRGRGEDVGFVPADKAPEPRFGLSSSCG